MNKELKGIWKDGILVETLQVNGMNSNSKLNEMEAIPEELTEKFDAERQSIDRRLSRV